MSQTTYESFPEVGLPGLRGDLEHGYTRTYNNTLEIINFGRIVSKISGEEVGCKLPATSGDYLLGAALQAQALQLNSQYALNSAVAVLSRGTIYVETEEAITPDDAVYVRYDGKSQVQTITFDADLVASNTIDLKIDGVSMTQITYASTHLDTMNAIASQITTDFSQIATATVGGASNRVLTLTAAVHATDFVISDIVVAGGLSQAGSTVAETVASISDDDRGKIRTDADSSTAVAFTGARVVRSGEAGKLAVIEINLP